jgi:protein-tyrosine-phosphatase
MAVLVLFVCTGNTCRSPMAEALLRAALPPTLSSWRVASAGLAAGDGAPASSGALAALREVGCDLGTHRTRAVTAARADEADVIVAMTEAHAQQLAQRFPTARDRIHLLRAFDPEAPAHADVSDPFCGSIDDYRHCRDLIRRALPGLIRFLQQTVSNGPLTH